MAIPAKLKICSGCSLPKKIWKNYNGQRFCKSCWKRQDPGKIQRQKLVHNKLKSVKPRRISPRSEKRIIADKRYSKLRKKLLEEYPMCQAHIQGVCAGASQQCHHKAGRVGKLYTDYSKFLAVCGPCHHEIEMKPEWAKEMGFSLNRL